MYICIYNNKKMKKKNGHNKLQNAGSEHSKVIKNKESELLQPTNYQLPRTPL